MKPQEHKKNNVAYEFKFKLLRLSHGSYLRKKNMKTSNEINNG
jgi:hypothetical protein